MREILFRGKRLDNGKWAYGNLIQRNIWGAVFPIIRAEDNGYGNFKEWEVIPETVGQYTGLKDKKGVKIFEGDVVRYLNSIESGNGVVIFDACAFLFNWIDIDETDSLLRHFQCSEELKIIGNIHDNPEVTE